MGLNHHNKVLQGCFTICGCSLTAYENRHYCCFHVLTVSQESGTAFVISCAVFFPSFFFFFSSKLVKYHENVRRAKTDYISSGLLQWPLSTSLPFNTWHKTLRRVLTMWNGDSGSGGERSSQRRLAAELRGYLMKCLRNEGA